jgi:subtilase family serine protease
MLFRSILLVAVSFVLLPGHCLAQEGSVRARISPVIDENNRVLLNGDRHPLARREFDREAAASNLFLNRMLLVLKRTAEQETALEALLDQQQNKASANYHAWLTPEQFGQQFGPGDQDIQTITSWLTSHGFQVARVANGRMIIEFSGTAGQVKETFHTEIHKYEVNGKEYWANSTDPEIPTALASVIAGITSLYNFPRKPLHRVAGVFSRARDTGPFQRLRPSSGSPLFTGGSNCGLLGGSCYALAPYDLATIYNVLPLWNASSPIDGTGQTIAIVGQSDIYTQDVSNFRSDFGLPQANLNIILNGPDPGKLATEGDETESDLDVEWSGAVAKGATIDFVISATTNSTAGVDLSAEYIVDNNLAPVMSESYGACELDMGTAGNQFYNQLWQQAAAEGITVFVAAGDSGSAVCDRGSSPATHGLSVNGIASTPYDVAVGGTDFNDLQNPSVYWNSTNNAVTQASAKSYIPEMTWNDSCTNSEFFQFTGSTNAGSDCNDSTSSYWPAFLAPVGASGGASNCTTSENQSVSSCAGGYAKPLWQVGVGVPDDGKRDLPDVSLFSGDGLNANFYVVCETDIYGGCAGDVFNVIGIGGTSAPTPVLAGIMAMVNQKMQSRQGQADFVFYPLAAQPGASCASTATAESSCIFYDVTTGTIAMPCVSASPNCVTNISGDQNGVLSGYSAAAGYDLATGLGSVNVSNLVNNWSAVSFQPTVTTLALSPTTNITHGSPVNASIKVAPQSGTGTPTGLVSLLASTGPQAGNFTLTNGSVSATTSDLPGGSYSVAAHYAGDGTYAGSDSSPTIPVTVSPEPSATTVQAFSLDQNGNSVPFTTGSYGGSVVYLRTTVAGKSGEGTPTGTVNLTQTLNGTTTNLVGDPYSLNSEGYTMTPVPGGFYVFFTPGTYSIGGTYSGDASFNPSTAPTVSFTITKATTSTSTSVEPCNTANGQCLFNLGSDITILGTITASSSVSSTQPSGTVTFYSNGTQFGSPVTVDTGISPPTASFSTNQLPLGQNSITAQYSGDTKYVGSVSSVVSVDMVIPTSVGLNASSSVLQPGQSVTFTAQLTPTQTGGPAATGSVRFSANGANIGNAVALSSSGQAQLTTNSLPWGAVQIAATYSGDADYSVSSGTLTETVIPFMISANPTVISVSSPGQSGSTTLTFAAQSNFTGSAALSSSVCSNLPPESTCSFNPSTVSFTSSTTTVPVTLTIATTAPSSLVPSRVRFMPGTRSRSPEMVFVCVVGLCVVLLATTRRSRLLAIVAFAAIVSTIGCGGGNGGSGAAGSSSTGTPAGNYTDVTLTVTVNGATQSINNLSLSVK